MRAADKPWRDLQNLNFGNGKKSSPATPLERAQRLEKMSSDVGKSMAAKFKSVRDCFRFIDEDHSGSVSRQEMQRLFQHFNYNESFANEFFDLLDGDGNGEIDFNELRGFIGPHIQPGYQMPVRAKHNIPNIPTVAEMHEMQHDTNKSRHRTTYGDMVQGLGLTGTKNVLMKGYGGHTPRIQSSQSFLDRQPDRDVLPVFFKEEHSSRLDARRVSESSTTTGSSRASHERLIAHAEGSVLRRLNEAAVVAGSTLTSSVHRSKSLN